MGRLTCSGIDAIPSFLGASTVSSSSFVVEGVFRQSGVVRSFKVVYLVLFVFESHVCIPLISRSSLHILYSLVHPVTLHRKHISAPARQDISLFVVTHVLLPYSSNGLVTTLEDFN